ncbi:CLUMA_CG003889, isoform A [Clunio marinus]|uniref:CLUMA_CG003889, isoform A n=1 Tax=Clunio marinus TaxID=568069 RepID=A0A1J1HQ52_9DIPT|nr:CLUMA_CG003889, isoform A [Clunio marinus]
MESALDAACICVNLKIIFLQFVLKKEFRDRKGNILFIQAQAKYEKSSGQQAAVILQEDPFLDFLTPCVPFKLY